MGSVSRSTVRPDLYAAPVELVIAEKPSVARDLARVLGVRGKGGDGDWLENERYAITWCIGHLVELDEPAAYDEAWKPWRLDRLPMLPAVFRLRPAQHAKAQLRTVKGDLVIDHVGKFLEPVATDHPSFRALLRLVESGRVWVKLSAPYEVSKVGRPLYGDVGALAKALVKAAPERMLWASNWPHPSATDANRPDDAELLDLLLDWAPDDAVRRKILADNPARLYGF